MLATDQSIGQTELDSPAAREWLATIAEWARDSKVALLCFEAEQERCHRDVVTEAVVGLGSDDRIRKPLRAPVAGARGKRDHSQVAPRIGHLVVGA